jgi:DNA-binding transcriptional LysR family regulator
MRGQEFAGLTAFLAVARQRSFTRAATDLGVSTSTLSQTIRSLEDRLGLRLLNRTTRSVAPTEAGEQLAAELGPALESIDKAIERLDIFRGTPRGTLRLNVGRVAALTVVAPLLARFIADHPGINVEVAVDDSHPDIVSERFDAGVRAGEWVDQDMIAVRISEEFRLVTVAAPSYLSTHRRPQTPRDLHEHNCIRGRLPWDGTIRRWEFERAGERIEVAVDGPLVVNDFDLALSAAIDGIGVAYLPLEWVQPLVDTGRLVVLLEEWAPSLAGFYLYYSSRRQVPLPLKAFVEFVQKANRSHPNAKLLTLANPIVSAA